DRVGGIPRQLPGGGNHPHPSFRRALLVQARRHISDHALRDLLRGGAIQTETTREAIEASHQPLDGGPINGGGRFALSATGQPG
ncbi:MAG: hypothetical protein INR62_09340, partial [Rhodospirillales bacterium]|nr:hypothetical protein [Acetobacter sp.]